MASGGYVDKAELEKVDHNDWAIYPHCTIATKVAASRSVVTII